MVSSPCPLHPKRGGAAVARDSRIAVFIIAIVTILMERETER